MKSAKDVPFYEALSDMGRLLTGRSGEHPFASVRSWECNLSAWGQDVRFGLRVACFDSHGSAEAETRNAKLETCHSRFTAAWLMFRELASALQPCRT